MSTSFLRSGDLPDRGLGPLRGPSRRSAQIAKSGLRPVEEAMSWDIDQLRAFLDVLPSSVAILDQEGNIVAVSRSWQLFATRRGHSPGGSGLGRNYLEICRMAAAAGEEDFVRISRGVAGVLSGALPSFETDYRVRTSSEPLWLNLSVAPFHGASPGAMIVHRDLTEQKLANETLQQARDAAEAATRVKSEFMAKVSHEIRTPLHGVLGMIDLTLGTELALEQRKYLQTARSAAEMLMRVINDVLDFSRIEAGKLSLDPCPFHLRSFLNDALESFQLAASRKGLRLESHVAPAVPDDLVGDPDRLRQILSNLIDNSIRFTETGVVSLRVHQEKVGDEEVRLRFAVSDTGIGISSEKLKVIFQPFVQADGSCTRRYGGSGLGLTIASQLVDLMGGTIWAESRPGKGSTFRFTARLRLAGDTERSRPEEPRRGLGTPTAKTPLRILLVDDSHFNVLFTTTLLSRSGHTISVANNGWEALAAVAEQSFDLILMDVQMPDMDGLQATAAIRALERDTGRHVPILAMTARAMKEDRGMCLRAGMDGYVSKPVRADDLLRAIADLEVGTAAGGPDRDALLAETGGDINLLRRLVEIFTRESDRLLGELRDAVLRADVEAVEEAAHALRGRIGHWGRGRALEVARRLEMSARDGHLIDAAAVDDLGREVSRLKAELELLLEDEQNEHHPDRGR